ncbi:CFC_collapsed_G0053580.mRNA.1.CDS.1 [Saccharomyces cerevisiae]|nr:CFC_collapsed_G0053580.mRNA.1.CDS.1 [Saccharomyces cerevisiae]
MGYLAASQSFYKDSDILMLATNLLKKRLKTQDRTHKKEAITALFKVFCNIQEALRDNFDKFVSKLDDDDISGF